MADSWAPRSSVTRERDVGNAKTPTPPVLTGAIGAYDLVSSMTRVEQRGPSLVRPCFWVCQNPRRHVRRYDEVAVQEGQAPTNEVPLLAEAED